MAIYETEKVHATSQKFMPSSCHKSKVHVKFMPQVKGSYQSSWFMPCSCRNSKVHENGQIYELHDMETLFMNKLARSG